MKVREYLERRQRMALRLIRASFENERVPHAFLLSGEPGIPLKDVAVFIAKSLLCDHPDPLADEACLTCRRVANSVPLSSPSKEKKEEALGYADFVLIDGSQGSIKKEQAQDLAASFSKTALEKKGILVYVIHLVENMGTNAVNSILKFLEEPGPNVYGILTTENASKLLPTIRSRCEEIRFLLSPRTEVIEEAVELGVNEEDAALLSSVENSAEGVKKKAASKSFKTVKGAYEAALRAFRGRKADIVYNLEREVVPALKDKEDARLFLRFLGSALRSALMPGEGEEAERAAFRRLGNPGRDLKTVLTSEGEIKVGIQPALVLEHVLRLLAEDIQ